MNYVVFDTETTSLDKPFCYNIGYSIRNENNQILAEKRVYCRTDLAQFTIIFYRTLCRKAPNLCKKNESKKN